MGGWNLQVVNKFDDGEERFAHDWLRQNERDMATLAWELAATRECRGFGSIKVLHQPGHPVTANGTFSYTEDWNHIERSRRPTLAVANLLHHARQRTETSR